ncbi:hypothetical protein ABIE79_004555 [Bradyrhizobium diazoefficiens]
MATSPNITNFSSANSTTFQVDGLTVYTDNANQPWSLTEPDANTLEFSVHPGDNWVGAGGGWSDAVNDGGANRSEIQFQQFYSAGTQINVSYGFTLQPGPVNNSTMVDIGQLHSTTQSPPSPVTVNLNTHDQLQISIQNPTSKDTLLWTDPAPIVRGQTYQITLQMNMNPTGNGYVGVWIDGTQVVDYHGPVGAAGAQYYWKEGIYRGPSDQIMTADYTNTHITTGPQAAPTSGTSTSGTTSGGTTVTTPTSGTSSTTIPSTPTSSVTKPVLTVADHSLWVAGRGGKVDLGTKVTTTDSNDHVTVNIAGLPRYETITDKLDGQTFRGDNITLTAAQVDSGLELHSYYRGGGHPTATLTLTASAKDPTTGAVATASPQTITVVDPRPATTTTTTTSSHHHHTATNQQPVATATAAAPTTSHTTESTDHQHTAAASTGSLASQGFARLQQHFDPAASTLATTAAHPIMAADHPAATGTTMASFASQSFALLNQYLAAHTGRVDPGQFVTALSQATGWGHDSLLARPQH